MIYRTSVLLDEYKRKLSIRTDAELAEHWDVVPQKVSHYRRGLHSFGDERAIAIADACGYDRGEVLLSIWAERAQKAKQDVTFSSLISLLQRLDYQLS